MIAQIKMLICLNADCINIPEAATPDLSDMVSSDDVGQSSMLANYSAASGDQVSLGK